MARLFFLNRTANNPLPVRPSRTGLFLVYQKQYQIMRDNLSFEILFQGESKVLKSNRSSQEVDSDDYPVEFRPVCQLHQIAMKMAISSEPQTYLITTLSISDAKNISQSEIEKQVSEVIILKIYLNPY